MQGRTVASAAQFTRAEVESLLALAAKIRTLDNAGHDFNVIPRKVLVPLFFENSTRTYSSFCAAFQKLGGQVVIFDAKSSSMAKGETLEDTIRTVDCYADLIVLRHPEQSALDRAIASATHPIINAGNGIGEHPSQSLLDAFTMQQELGHIDNLVIGLCGDLKNGRTVHSLSKLLSLFTNVTFKFISPPELRMPAEIVEYLTARSAKYEVCEALTPEVVASLDVLYVTRIQKERFSDLQEYERLKGCYVVTPKTLEAAKAKMVVMHPLPRVDEIDVAVDSDPRAAYFRQMRYGLHLRMALIAAIFGKEQAI